MQFRPLGRTGLEVSAVGFGAWGLAAELWHGVDPAEAKGALRAALDGGCNFIDTALIYGPDTSERVVGAVLRERGAGGERVVVASKIPPLDRRWPPDPAVGLEQVFPAWHVIASVEASLGNLGMGALPLEQLHVWLDDWLDSPSWPELEETMRALVRAGKVLHWGVSANDHAPDTALRVLDVPIVEAVQVIYNVFDRSPERALLPRAAARSAGVIARVPFDEGALVGAVTADSVFDPRDFRSRYFRGERAAEAAARAERLRALLGDEAASLAELALRFCLSRPEVSTVIPGARRAAHARANLAAGDGARCAFVSEDGRRCEETGFLELDHVVPVARGGESSVEGMRVLCRSHNQHEAERILGREAVVAGKAARAVDGDLIAGLRRLGVTATDARQAVAAAACRVPGTLEERMRAALGALHAIYASRGVGTRCEEPRRSYACAVGRRDLTFRTFHAFSPGILNA